jgi:hypothetical protein
MVRGFVSVVVAIAALGALAVWLWLRPLREGFVQGVWLWLGCALLVGVMAMVWWPSHDEDHLHRHVWVVVAGLLAVSGIMAAFGVVVARDDRRPGLRRLIDGIVATEPVAFENETSWAYQPRYVGACGNTDWSVCRTYVVSGDPTPVVVDVHAALDAAGVDASPAVHTDGDGTWRYAEVRVEGEHGDRLVVCVDEVDPTRR